MNIERKNQITNLLITIKTTLKHAKNNISESMNHVTDSCATLKSIVSSISSEYKDYNLKSMEDLLNKLNNFSELDDKAKEELLLNSIKEIEQIIEQVKNYIEPKQKLKVVFLTYRASMWTSLESIWEAANNDPECEAVVMPIPYHELDGRGHKVKINYEGEEYPSYVPVKKYWQYDIREENPDIIFIHNPYDETNTLIRVDDEFYSRNLKLSTEMLVYVPYHLQYMYPKEEHLKEAQFIALRSVDKIIVENKQIRKKYEEKLYNRGKVFDLGSPKIDAMKKMMNSEVEICTEWKEKINGRHVFLMNTTEEFFVQENKKAIKVILDIYNTVGTMENCFLIWRPHHLEETWIKNNLPGFLEVYNKLRKLFGGSDYTLVDSSSDYRQVFSLAEGMFSSHSYLVNEFMATGKPVSIMSKYFDDVEYCVGTNNNYHVDEKPINEFIEDVITKKDAEVYEERLKAFNKSIVNSEDASCGKKVYEDLKAEVLFKRR